MYKVGIDIGGTFTDCVIIDGEGRSTISKALTTTADPSTGVLDALAAACRTLGLTVEKFLPSCDAFFHSCTIGTNAIIERRGARTAFVTTRGHEDMLLIGKISQKVAGLTEMEIIHTSRLNRAEPPLVPRDLTFGVSERVTWNGEVLVPLRQDELDRLAAGLADRQVEAVAVCLLWSFMNPRHEQAIKQLLREKLPRVYCSISSEISPTFGEYERATATVLNAYIGPKVQDYLVNLQAKLAAAGYARPLLVMQCQGGTTYVGDAAARAVLTVDSGPVGGVAGGKWLARQYGEPNLICTDVGGTSFDVGLIYGGEPQLEDEPVIEKYRFRIPKVAVRSIGAGGGSIAWLDAANVLRVGPQSAGADPGPACYSKGGEQPTVTDADLVLGYLNPDYFLGGALKLDRQKAAAALRPLADRMGKDIVGVAHAIFKIMNAQMADLIRKCTVERGFDPRHFSLIAYGGAGPTHVAFYSADVQARRIYVLPNATVFSAFGILTSPITHYAMMSRRQGSPYPAAYCRELDGSLKLMSNSIMARFTGEGIPGGDVELARSLTMRYNMQVHEIEVAIEEDELTPAVLRQVIIPRFEKKYADIYGTGTEAKEAGTEIITGKVVGRYYHLAVEKIVPEKAAAPGCRRKQAAKGERRAFFEMEGSLAGVATAIYDGHSLAAGDRLEGPAIVERYGDAIVIPPGCQGEVDDMGTISLTVKKR
jgi:N-methylhydantoinase A/oxoprolinase/acetone carboxylase beta subunit